MNAPDSPNALHPAIMESRLSSHQPTSQALIVLIALALLTSGCQSTATDTDGCTLVAGMKTAELAACGCFSANTQSRYVIGLDQGTLDQQTQDVAILNYYCPLGSVGIARVMVVNGVAKEVFQ